MNSKHRKARKHSRQKRRDYNELSRVEKIVYIKNKYPGLSIQFIRDFAVIEPKVYGLAETPVIHIPSGKSQILALPFIQIISDLNKFPEQDESLSNLLKK